MDVRAVLRRPVWAALLLLVAYVALSFLNDHRGYLGTDTGGKVATFKAMERNGGLDPDLGYWAERWDPQGKLHPLYYTSHLDGKWVNVTTLPALYAAYPLFRMAGYRGALLVPMVGSVLAALAARALTKRLLAERDGADWWPDVAFWLVGLASPLTIYALDFWEHSIGVALMAWAVVLLVDVAQGRGGWKAAGGAGLLLGGAATMRTEALVYAAVAAAVMLAWAVWRSRRLVAPAIAGAVLVAGVVMPLVANNALEQATIGTRLRADRAAGTVRLAVSQGEQERVDEALLTALSPFPTFDAGNYLYGVALLGLVGLAVTAAARPPAEQRVGWIAGAGAAVVYFARFVSGLGFVPGLIPATPLAAAGATRGWARGTTARLVLAVAVLSLPLVWAFQYTGGAAPQWAGRYILTSGLLLGVVGVAALAGIARWAQVGAATLAAAVTCFGLVWLSVRSHDAASASEALSERPEPVLVSRVAHLAREGGYFVDRRRWLTADDLEEERLAADVLTEARIDRFGLVELEEVARLNRPHDFPGFRPAGVDRLEYFSGVDLRITAYERVPPA